LGSILIVSFFLRLYRFNSPIADWHEWRQADTSAVSRNFVKDGFDFLHPRYDDISNVQTGVDNPNGYRFVEFPLYNIAQAGLFKLLDYFTIEEWGRLITIFSSLLSIVFIYTLGKKHANTAVGLLSAFFFAFIPYDVFYGRTILPDPSMAMAILGGIYFFDKWIDEKLNIKNKKLERKIKYREFCFFILAILFTASSLLLKPYALFFTLPIVYLAWKKLQWNAVKEWKLWVFAIFSLLPFVFWRMWIRQYPEGVPASAWLLNGNGIRFKPSFFRWIFYERLTKLISGYTGIIIFLLGIIRTKIIKEYGFFYSFLFASLLYIVVFATGNVQHDYYQILIMPTVAFFYGIGAYSLFFFVKKGFPIGKLLVIGCTLVLFLSGWNQVKDYFNINNPSIISAGLAVDRLTPRNAKVLAPLDGDTALLYQTRRKGWPSFEHSLEDLIKMGADYLVLVNPKEPDYAIGKKYKIIAESKEYILFDLHKNP